MLCQQRYADSPSQFTFLGTYTPVWLTFKWAKSQSNRWAKWQETKMLWMYIVWVWRVKLPLRDIQVNAHHTAMWRQHRDMSWIAKFKMSSVTAAFKDRKNPVNGCHSWPCLGGIQEGIAMERQVQRKMTFLSRSHCCHPPSWYLLASQEKTLYSTRQAAEKVYLLSLRSSLIQKV